MKQRRLVFDEGVKNPISRIARVEFSHFNAPASRETSASINLT
jgi:hypothetical protein